MPQTDSSRGILLKYQESLFDKNELKRKTERVLSLKINPVTPFVKGLDVITG